MAGRRCLVIYLELGGEGNMQTLRQVMRIFLWLFCVYFFLISFGLPNPEHPLPLRLFELGVAMAAAYAILRINELLFSLVFEMGSDDSADKDDQDGG